MTEKYFIDDTKEKLVQEVIDIIDNPNFLAGVPIELADENVYTDLNQAGFYYGRTNYKGFDKKTFYYTWGELITFRYKLSLFNDFTINKIKEYSSIIHKKVNRNISKICNEARSLAYCELSDEAGFQLTEIATYRALSKRKIKYYEDMLNIYKMGGLPCGWVGGRFPYEGNFLIFSLTDNPVKELTCSDPNDKYSAYKQIYDFGDNFVYIKEIIDLVSSDNFLKGLNSFKEDEHQTSSLEKAVNNYKKQTHYLPSIFPNRKKRLTSMYKLDKTLNESFIDNLINESKTRYQIHEQFFLIMSKIYNSIDAKIEAEMSSWEKNLSYYIGIQLESCLVSRAIQGNSNLYYERMLEAYKTGGWPCGFTGNWPDVKFKIYYPINESQNTK